MTTAWTARGAASGARGVASGARGVATGAWGAASGARGVVAGARDLVAGARGAATAIAAARTAIGVVALVSPSLVARPWIGDGRGVPARVLGRALGGRDLALGLGALAALRRMPPGAAAAGGAGLWVAAGALADSLDAVTTAAAWDGLPAVGRWLVAMSAGGAAVAGGAAAWSLLTGEPACGP
jgi:hypothetical protein